MIPVEKLIADANQRIKIFRMWEYIDVRMLISQYVDLINMLETAVVALDKIKSGPGNSMYGWRKTWAHTFSSKTLTKINELAKEVGKGDA